MKLIFLGTTGYHPNERRHTMCMLIPEHGIMLDAGSGAFRTAKFLQMPELDIFLTHAHLDHVVGLTYLLDVMRAYPLRRVTIHAMPDKLAAVEEHLFAEALFPKKPACEFRPLAETVGLPGGGKLTHFPLKHPGGTVGYRLDWPDHSMGYVTDTTASADAAYVENLRGVDLLVHECYFPDAQADWAKLTGHSCTTPVAEVARRAGVKRLILTHINPMSDADDPIGLDVAQAIFPATELGADGMEVEF